MPSLSGLLGSAANNDSAQQLFLWGVLYGLLNTVFEPVLTDISQEVWEGAVQAGLHQALSPDELATQVVRGWRDQGSGEAEASKGGVDSGDFDTMVNNRRNPIAPEEAAVALRRKIIPETADPTAPSFENAIKQGNLGDQWGPVIQQLATQIPSPSDILRAALQAQIPAGQDPVELYQQVGGDPSWYQLMFDTEGAAPTPDQAAQMAYRGVIPWTGSGPGVVSYEQAFLEGPWRNKWMDAFRVVTAYLPPPRTVTAMLKEGSLTPAVASELLAKQGLTPDLVAAYIASATAQKATTTNALKPAEIATLYQDHLLSQADATGMLVTLGLTSAEAGYLLAAAEAKRGLQALQSAISRIQSLYIGHKIDKAAALAALTQLGLPADQTDAMLVAWDVAAAANVRQLSAAEITDLLEYGIDDQATCQALLEGLGFTPLDAWRVLSIKNKAALPGRPAG